MATHHFQRWVDNEDFGRFEEDAREAVRSDDLEAKRAAAEAVWPWLWNHWEDKPLPRLSELLTALGPLREGGAPAELRAAEGKYIEDVLWDQTLRDHTDRALSAVLDTITRARSADVGWRVDRLIERIGERKDPRITSVFLHWLEAPPLRAISTQPMWASIFDLLFEQGDARTLSALEELVEMEFPAGKTMRTWMGKRLQDQLERWQERADIEALQTLSLPSAEGDLTALLDPIANAVALLTGTEVIAAGGGVVVPSAADFLEPQESAESPWPEGGTPIEGPAISWNRWHTIQADASKERVMAHDNGQQLVVRGQTGQLLWAHSGTRIGGVRLDPSGRWLVAVVGGDSVRMVDLDNGKAATAKLINLEKPLPHGGREPSVVFDSETSFLLSIGIRRQRLFIFRVHFGPEPLEIQSVETVVELNLWEILDKRVRNLPAENLPDGAELVAPALAYDGGRRLFAYGRLLNDYKDLAVALELSEEGVQVLHAWLEPSISSNLPAPGRFRFMEDGRIAARMMTRTGWRNADERGAVAISLETAWTEKIRSGDKLVPDPVADIRRERPPAPASVDCVTADHAEGTACIVGGFLYWHRHGNTQKVAGTHRIACLSPDGELLANSDSRSFRLLKHGDSGQGTLIKAHKDDIRQLVAFDDHLAFLTLADDGIMGWTRDGERLLELRHRQSPLYMARHPSEPLLASFDGSHLYLWETDHGTEVSCVELEEPPTDVVGLGWGLDQASVLFATSKELWEWRPGADALKSALAFAHPLAAFISVPELGFLAASNQQSQVEILQLDNGELSVAATFGLASIAHSLAVRPNGELVTSSSWPGATGSMGILRPSSVSSRSGDDNSDPENATHDDFDVADWELLPLNTDQVTAVQLERSRSGQAAAREAAAKARQRILVDPPKTSVPQKKRDKIRKRLRSTRSRVKAIQEFRDTADEAWWQLMLAEWDPLSTGGDDAIFESRGSESTGHLAQLVSGVDVPIARLYAATFTGLVQWQKAWDFSGLELPNLESLRVSQPDGWQDLRGMPSLQRLSASATRDYDREAWEEALGNMQGPESLEQLSFQLPQSAKEAPSFEGLPFSHITINGGKWKILNGIENVRGLSVSNNAGWSSPGGVEQCHQLERLAISRCQIRSSLADVATALENGSPLSELTLNGLPKLTSFAGLEAASKLEKIKLDKVWIETFEHLESARPRELDVRRSFKFSVLTGLNGERLETLRLQECGVERLDDPSLVGGALHSVEIERCKKLQSVEALQHATGLRVLDLRNCENLASLPSLEDCKELELVMLSGTRITPDDVSPHVLERASWAASPQVAMILRG